MILLYYFDDARPSRTHTHCPIVSVLVQLAYHVVAREVVNEEYDPEASQEPESEAPREISSYCDVQIVLSPAELKTFALRRHKLINDMKNRYKKSTLGVNVSDVNNGNGKG